MAKKKQNSIITKLPEPPLYFSEVERAQWEKLGNVLIADKLLMTVDLSILELACSMWASYREALSSGEAADAIKFAKEYAQILTTFGATPRARQVLKLSKTGDLPDEDADLLEEFGRR